MSKIKIIIASFFVLTIVLLYSSIYIVNEREQAVVFQFGDPVNVVQNPGLYFKTPIIQNVMKFEKRILEWDGDPTVIPMSGDMFISVDTFARWIISDPKMFYKS